MNVWMCRCMYVLRATISTEIALLSCSFATCMCYYHLDLSWANKWLINWSVMLMDCDPTNNGYQSAHDRTDRCIGSNSDRSILWSQNIEKCVEFLHISRIQRLHAALSQHLHSWLLKTGYKKLSKTHLCIYYSIYVVSNNLLNILWTHTIILKNFSLTA